MDLAAISIDDQSLASNEANLTSIVPIYTYTVCVCLAARWRKSITAWCTVTDPTAVQDADIFFHTRKVEKAITHVNTATKSYSCLATGTRSPTSSELTTARCTQLTSSVLALNKCSFSSQSYIAQIVFEKLCSPQTARKPNDTNSAYN